jgi:hypothetical protein
MPVYHELLAEETKERSEAITTSTGIPQLSAQSNNQLLHSWHSAAQAERKIEMQRYNQSDGGHWALNNVPTDCTPINDQSSTNG